MRLTRAHAAEWHIDPPAVSAFSDFPQAATWLRLCRLIPTSSNPARQTPHINSSIDARPDFALILYPGYLADTPALDTLDPALKPPANTPPTFLLQAENDPVHVENVLVYFQALKSGKDSCRAPHLRRGRPRLRPAPDGPAGYPLARSRRHLAQFHPHAPTQTLGTECTRSQPVSFASPPCSPSPP